MSNTKEIEKYQTKSIPSIWGDDQEYFLFGNDISWFWVSIKAYIKFSRSSRMKHLRHKQELEHESSLMKPCSGIAVEVKTLMIMEA